MEYVIDLNVIIDFLLIREPFFEDAKQVLLACQNKKIKGYICADSVSTLFYILNKQFHSKKKVYDILDKLFMIIKVIPLMSFVVNEARLKRERDFEDCEVALSAKYAKCDGIITRNKKDFEDFGINIYTPKEFLATQKIANK